jgi:uncharacterized membrane protein HdeD (DUF308 family)
MLSAALALFVFPPAYHYTSSGLWRYSRVGRALMAFMGVLAAVMVLAVTSLIVHPLPQVVRVITWAAISFVSWRQVWMLFRVRNRDPVDPARGGLE